jgi:hypothetical protein
MWHHNDTPDAEEIVELLEKATSYWLPAPGTTSSSQLEARGFSL